MTNPYESLDNFVTVNGMRFHYALDGDSEMPVLALVNMASVNLTNWEVVLDGLLTHHQVLRFDIRGTGKSGWGDDAGFTFSQYADDLAAIMDELEIPKAFVLGVAYGARTAARFGLRHEDRLSALGMFDVSLSPPVAQGGQRQLGEQARQLLAAAGEPDVERRKYWRFYEDRDAALKAHTAHEREEDITDKLGHLKVPVLVACGREDMNLAEAQRIHEAIPGSQFEIMEMTGHGSPMYRPELFVDIVNAFTAQHIGGPE